jgi:c-di-GMP-binding flagellar brake protein YcgR
MGQESLIEFDSLDLKMGQTIELFPNVKDLSVSVACQLIGSLEEQALIISNLPSADSFPALEEGQQIAIRVKSGNGIALFASLVLFISEVPALMIFIDLPEKVKFVQLRKASRINVALPILVSLKSGESKTAGKMVDVSTGGAAILLEDAIADEGDLIQIKGKFLVADVAQIALFDAVVRRKTRDATGKYLFGIEFSEQEDQKKLVLFGYIFQAMALGDVQAVVP